MKRKNLLWRLGLPRNTKLLIVHADDIGLSHATNKAVVLGLENGSITSGSVMVPCPWFLESVRYFRNFPKSDIGIHLTLTCEWDNYKWKPILPANDVSSLIDEFGYFSKSVSANINFHQVDRELRAQIDTAISLGLNPTHLDCHEFCLYEHIELLKIYIQLGSDYDLPIMLNRELAKIKNIELDNYIDVSTLLVDHLFIAQPRDVENNGLEGYYTNILRTLSSGLSVILIHPSFDNDETFAITSGTDAWGSRWRQDDYNFFTSQKFINEVVDNNIRLITWQEIVELLMNCGK